MPKSDSGKDPTADLDALGSFLMSGRAPENAMGLSDLDGFLTAIAIGPEPIMPSAWLPVVWDDKVPDFASQEEAERILAAIMGRYNEIVSALRNGSGEWMPVFWEMEDGEVIVEDWAAGFLEGVQLRMKAWAPLLDDPEAGTFMTPIVLAGSTESAAEQIGVTSEQVDEVLQDAVETIPLCVIAISRFWQERQGGRPLAS